jgi:hypothetical protein
MKRLIILSTILLSTLAFAFSQQDSSPKNGEDLIGLMYGKYSQDWYSHLTFKQDMYRYRDDSLILNEVWIVAYSAPGKLNIRYKDFDSGRGWLIINDTLFSFNHNKLIGKNARLHELMTLGFDLYIAPPDETVPKVVEMNFDLSKLTTATINGNLVYQVGNPDIQCFWVHKDDLLFYGYRKTGEGGVKETFFGNYKSFYGKLVATQVQYFQNGHLYLFEKYFEIRLPTSLPESFFEPDKFGETRW